MSEESTQMLSSLVDGELPSTETGQVIDQTHLDPDLRAKWARYHLMGEAVRGGLPRHIDVNLASRISAAVAAEPAILVRPAAVAAGPAKAVPRLLKPAAGLAIAASVALAAVVTVQHLAVPPAAAPGAAQQLAAMPGVTEPTVTPNMEMQPVEWNQDQTSQATAAARSRMNDYLLNYSERRANWGAPGMLPYVKVVGYENDQ